MQNKFEYTLEGGKTRRKTWWWDLAWVLCFLLFWAVMYVILVPLNN